jgi:cyclopropane-fatty-acyl-phospholipid synthase
MNAAETQSLGVVDGLFRRAVHQTLAGLSRGALTLVDRMEKTTFGGGVADPTSVVEIRDARFYRRLVTGGSLAAAESYLDGDWDCDGLTDLIRLLVRNERTLNRLDGTTSRFAAIGARLRHFLRANTKSGSRTNIRAHYDLGNEFFQLWLDDTMAYSSGVFRDRSNSLHAASTEKFDRVCRKLDLQRDDRMIEIGSGWGGLALHAAGVYGAHVTTTTISERQFEETQRRVSAAGFGRRIAPLLQDYRDLEGKFDKLVSIEMIEAVGHQYLDVFFRRCSDLLEPDGTMLIQAIVMPESRHAAYLRSVDFIQRYIFPGGCLPSVASMLESVGRASDLRLVHVEDLAPHYAETLRRWHRRFLERVDDVRRLGYDERFIRLWRFYLSYCEALFEERHIGVVQLQFDKPECRRDPIEISRWASEPLRRPAAERSA